MENDYTNIFQKACLVQLSTSVWQGCCKLPEGIMKRVGKKSEWLRGSKNLVNPELLGPVRKVSTQARDEIRKHSLPFPIHSVYLISKEALTKMDQKLQHFEAEFWEKAHDFIAIIDMAKEEAMGYLEDLYNEADYPQDITRKFGFEWRFLTLDVPGKSTLLPPEIYEREKEKFQSMMDETRELAISALREEFGRIVTSLSDKLNKDTTQPKVIKGSMFKRLQEFLDDFGTRNIFEDNMLVELSDQARNLIEGVSSGGVKPNEVMLKKIRKQMNQLKSAIDGAIEDMPKRKIRMAV